jgi:anti-sigma regulatory factor (Ser/Thr protein kinase)
MGSVSSLRPRLSHHVTLDGGLNAPTRAREELDRVAPPELRGVARDDVLLMLSELVANSVRHAGSTPGEHIELTFEWSRHVLHVRVADSGPSFDCSALPPPDPVSGSGWGLHLVDMLSSAWGVSAEPPGVWFDFDVAAGPNAY